MPSEIELTNANRIRVDDEPAVIATGLRSQLGPSGLVALKAGGETIYVNPHHVVLVREAHATMRAG
jgi:hypothetical protein